MKSGNSFTYNFAVDDVLLQFYALKLFGIFYDLKKSFELKIL